MVFFNPKITIKYIVHLTGYFLHLLAYDYVNDYECYPREEWDTITIIRINIYGCDL